MFSREPGSPTGNTSTGGATPSGRQFSSSLFRRSSVAFRRSVSVRPSQVVAASRSSRFLRQDGGASTSATSAVSQLQGRLEEILIFELRRDGSREYLNLSVRGLYRHVIKSITGPVQTDKVEPIQPPAPALADVDEDGEAGGGASGSGSNGGSTDDDGGDGRLLRGGDFNNSSSDNIDLLDDGGDGIDNTDKEKQVSFSQHVTVQQPDATVIDNAIRAEAEAAAEGVTTASNAAAGRGGGAAGSGGGLHGATGEVTYRERLGGYLHPRDMRRLVTPFSASNEPELIVRRHVMLLNFDPLRAVILRDRLLVLVPEGADSLLITLEKRVRGGAIDMAYSFATNEFSDFANQPSSAPPSDAGPSSAPASESGYNSRDDNCDAYSDISLKFGGDLQQDSSGHNSTSRHGSRHGNVIIDKLRGSRKGDSQPFGEDHEEMRDSVHSQFSRSKAAASHVVSKIKNTITHSKKKDQPTAMTASTTTDEAEVCYPEWEEMKTKDWIDLPFELQCADAVLHVVCSILSDDTNKLQDTTLNYLNSVLSGQYGLSDDPLSGLRHIKDAIHEMGSRVKGFVQSMNRILDDDEDMALMNLSRLITHPNRFIKPVPQEVLEEEADEPELILEAHMQIGLTLSNTLDLMQGQIDTASELVDQKLDSVRNRILFANMIISVLSLCVGSASLVGSLFGMNVTNFLEESKDAFKIITTTTVVGSFTLMIVIMTALFFSGAIPSPGMKEG